MQNGGMGDLHGTIRARSSMQNGDLGDLHGTIRAWSSMQNGGMSDLHGTILRTRIAIRRFIRRNKVPLSRKCVKFPHLTDLHGTGHRRKPIVLPVPKSQSH